ncbi:hypothetical protein MPOCJGCO_0824 [Methylobacterium trifolii]|uniref:Uncharacterized protein n=1 Tax=Methylobacterium trifolii TaxID=1003092 RepID=A0ABQ4TTU6_9HYPH|nr:hypothetical protein MPOCJGCO_0824 [Methylobacterium trifolii]
MAEPVAQVARKAAEGKRGGGDRPARHTRS